MPAPRSDEHVLSLERGLTEGADVLMGTCLACEVAHKLALHATFLDITTSSFCKPAKYLRVIYAFTPRVHAGVAGARLRRAIQNQAKPRVACALACNRLHADAKGTTSNELAHRGFSKCIKSCGGTRTYGTLSTLSAFSVWSQNGAHPKLAHAYASFRITRPPTSPHLLVMCRYIDQHACIITGHLARMHAGVKRRCF